MASDARREADGDVAAGVTQDSFQRYLHAVVEAVPCAVSVKLASDLSYVVVNRAARELLGARLGALGKTDRDLFPAREARRIQSDDQCVLASGVAGPVIVDDLTTSRGIRRFSTQKFPVVGIEGASDLLITVSEDVTASAQLLSNTNMWEEVFEHSARGMVVGRPDGTTLDLMNPAFAQLFGSTLEELAGRPLLDIFDPSVHDTVIAMLELVRADGQRRFETLCRRKNGSTFPAVIEATAAKSADGTARYRVIRIQDVSLLKSQEQTLRHDRDQAERANAAKSLFIAAMSHELRTPLNVILGFSQVMQLDDLTATQAESVGHILQAGRHLLAIIDDALDISRVESEGIALTLQPVRVTTIVGSVLALMQPLAESAGIRMVNESKNSRLYAMADQHRLLQVLLNLTTNAINYNVPGGEVRLHVARRSRSVNISVTDSGLGIPPGSAKRLFVPFDRLGREGSNIEGTGLGLSLSKALAEAMGGTITAAPNEGPGTTFTLALEACPPSERVLGSSWTLTATEDRLQQVLFIEGSLASIGLMEEVLRLRPHLGILNAMQAGIGIQLARHHQPDVIILDANLPDLTGEETVRRLSKDPRTRDIPLIMAGAAGGARHSAAPTKHRPQVYLTNPIQISELLAAIDAVIGTREDVQIQG